MTTQIELKNPEAEQNGESLPRGWRVAPLGEVAEINPRRQIDLQRADDLPTTFVPMAAVDEQHGVISRAETKPFAEVKKGYTYFTEGDVLFAKITPCMQNGKHAIARKLIDAIGFGTTEFHVIHPGADLASEWIHFYIRQPHILRNAMAHFTGAVGQQRVPKDYLSNLQIPLPPLTEQKRIARILRDQLAAVEGARAAAKAQLEAAKALPSAYLRDVFEGDEGSAWPLVPVKQLLASALRTGISKPADASSEMRCLTLSAVRNGRLKAEESKPVALSRDELKKNSIKPGAFYLVRGNGNRNLVGRSGQAPIACSPIAFPDLLIEVVPNESRVLGRFLRFVWDCPKVRRDIEDRARTAAGIYKIDLRNLSEVLLPIPEITVQDSIANQLDQRFQETTKLERSCRDQLAAIESMPAALLRSAFQGQL